jgi:hypothetical protein
MAIYCISYPLYRLWYPRKPLLPLMYSGLTISRTSDSYLSCPHNTLACSQGSGMVRCAIWRHCKGRERKGGFVLGTCCGLTANTVSAVLDLSLLDCQHQVPTTVGTLLLRTIWEASIQWKEFLISNFRLVLKIVCFLLGNSPASEFYMPTFRNTLSIPPS